MNLLCSLFHTFKITDNNLLLESPTLYTVLVISYITGKTVYLEVDNLHKTFKCKLFKLNKGSFKSHIQEQTCHSACARSLPATSWRSSTTITLSSSPGLLINRRQGYLSFHKGVFGLSPSESTKMFAHLCLVTLDSNRRVL